MAVAPTYDEFVADLGEKDRKNGVFGQESSASSMNEADMKRFYNESAPGIQAQREAAEAADRKANSGRIAQEQQAKDFEAAAPGLKENAFQGVAGQERRRLAGEMSGIRSGANSRGLLFSGMRQGQEAGAQGTSEVNLAGARQGINNTVNDQIQKYKEAPINTGLHQADVQNNISNQAMSMAISNMQANNSAMSGLGSAIGQGVGTYLGRQNKANGTF